MLSKMLRRTKEVCLCCVSDGVLKRSLIVTLIVGAILNLINQGDVLFGGGQVNWVKMILTFVVPYCVATYGAAAYCLASEARDDKRPQPHLADKPPVLGET